MTPDSPRNRRLAWHLTMSAASHARCAARVWLTGIWKTHTPATLCSSAWEQWWDEQLDELVALPARTIRCLRGSFEASFYSALNRGMQLRAIAPDA